MLRKNANQTKLMCICNWPTTNLNIQNKKFRRPIFNLVKKLEYEFTVRFVFASFALLAYKCISRHRIDTNSRACSRFIFDLRYDICSKIMVYG